MKFLDFFSFPLLPYFLGLLLSFLCFDDVFGYNNNQPFLMSSDKMGIFQSKRDSKNHFGLVSNRFFSRSFRVSSYPFLWNHRSSNSLRLSTLWMEKKAPITNDIMVDSIKPSENQKEEKRSENDVENTETNSQDFDDFLDVNTNEAVILTNEIDIPQALYKKEVKPDRTKIDVLITKTKENDFKRGEIANLSITKNKRRKYGFWHDISSIEIGVKEFWSNLGLRSTVLPNEALLRLFNGHGLRYAIRRHGGREVLHYMLGIPIMPGSWKEANQFEEIQYLLKQNKLDNLSFKTATWSNSEKEKVALISGPRGGAKFVMKGHKTVNSKTMDKPKKKSYSKWSEERLAEELFTFSEIYSEMHGIPKIFFPRLYELSKIGRNDIILAIRRYGGYEVVCERLGFISYAQWSYFVRLVSMIRDLRQYFEENNMAHKGDQVMPKLGDLRKNEKYRKLANEISRNGGVKLVSMRLNIPLWVTVSKEKRGSSGFADFENASFGDFDLDFAEELLEYILTKCWEINPRIVKENIDLVMNNDTSEFNNESRLDIPDIKTHVLIPTKAELLEDGRIDLYEKINSYGGFENVARRLQLGYRN